MRHNIRLLALMTLLGLLAAAGYAYLQPIVYQASATGVVVAGDARTVGGAMGGSALAQQRATTYVSLVETTAVRDRIAEDPEVQARPEAAEGSLSASGQSGSAMIFVTATGSTGENARILADAALRALAAEALELETLAPGDPKEAPITLDEVAVRIAAYAPAEAPAKPISPNWTWILTLGAAIGLGAGLIIGFLKQQLDVRIRTMSDVEEETGHGVLGIIPDNKELAKHRTGAPIRLSELGNAGEALRQLRTNLRFVNVDHPPRSVVLTSSTPGEGKSTISSLLAVLIARSGQPVVLIDADLRKPVQHKIFNADHAIGLSQVLIGDIGLEDALQATNEPNLRILTSGKVPGNPSEMVGSKRMGRLIENLATHHFVIVDAPPMLAVTDAGLLATITDGAVIVTRVGKTRKPQLKMAMKLIEQVGGKVLGTVMHRAPSRSMGDVVYGAGYGGHYKGTYGDYGDESSLAADDAPIRAQAASADAVDEAPVVSAKRRSRSEA